MKISPEIRWMRCPSADSPNPLFFLPSHIFCNSKRFSLLEGMKTYPFGSALEIQVRPDLHQMRNIKVKL
jgi:hypothetical protein